MEQQIQQQPQQVQQPAPVQEGKKQKSLFWIITTMYLTMILTGLVIGFVLILIGSFILSQLQGFAADFASLLLMIATYVIALKIAVNYVAKKTLVNKEDIVKISIWVALLTIVLYGIAGSYRGFSANDWIIIPSAALIFFAAKYFLEKKFKNT